MHAEMRLKCRNIYIATMSIDLQSDDDTIVPLTRGCRVHVNSGEIYDCAIKVFTKNFYCSSALPAIKLLRVLSLKFCLTLSDQFDSIHQRNVVV